MQAPGGVRLFSVLFKIFTSPPHSISFDIAVMSKKVSHIHAFGRGSWYPFDLKRRRRRSGGEKMDLIHLNILIIKEVKR
jgi:hypothetical protein